MCREDGGSALEPAVTGGFRQTTQECPCLPDVSTNMEAFHCGLDSVYCLKFTEGLFEIGRHRIC